jgi:hypothetical protein
MKARKIVVPALCFLALFSMRSPLRAQSTTIYGDDFPGSSSNLLNGTSPAIESGSFGGSASATWSAADYFNADGSVAASGGFSSAVLAFTPEAGNIYTLSADINNTSGDSTWIALGFEGTDNTGGAFLNNSGYDWLLLRGNRGTNQGQLFDGLNTAGSTNFNTPTGTVDFSEVLNTIGTDWTAEWFENGAMVGGPFTYTTNPVINYVGFSEFDNGAGTVGNFSLTAATATQAVPEPSAAASVLLGAACLLAWRRRRNRAAV